jgi:hypothetical protein
MGNWQRSLIGVGLGGALVPIVLSISVTPTRAHPPGRLAAKEPAAMRCAGGPTVGQGREPRAGPSPEERELLGFQVEMERDQLRLAESRLERAMRWESRARELAHYGRMPMEQLLVAQDGALMRQSDVVAQRTALWVAELRLAQAQREISSDRSLTSRLEWRPADVERRLAALERAVQSLRQETEHVKFDVPIQISTDRR